MKSTVGKAGLLAVAAMAASSSVFAAQSVVPGPRTDSTARIVLLPGPTLLSPARGAPQSGATITIVPASVVRAESERQFRFVPAHITATPGNEPAVMEKLKTGTPPGVMPPANTLRFDEKLKPADTALPKQQKL